MKCLNSLTFTAVGGVCIIVSFSVQQLLFCVSSITLLVSYPPKFYEGSCCYLYLSQWRNCGLKRSRLFAELPQLDRGVEGSFSGGLVPGVVLMLASLEVVALRNLCHLVGYRHTGRHNGTYGVWFDQLVSRSL